MQTIAVSNTIKKDAKMNNASKWLKVQTKGLITLPKNWRDRLNLEEGKLVEAKQVGQMIIIQASNESQQEQSQVPYRLYSQAEIDEFLEEDQLSLADRKKAGLDVA